MLNCGFKWLCNGEAALLEMTLLQSYCDDKEEACHMFSVFPRGSGRALRGDPALERVSAGLETYHRAELRSDMTEQTKKRERDGG